MKKREKGSHIFKWVCNRYLNGFVTQNVRDRFKQDRQRTNNVTLWHVHKTIVAVEKAISITYSEYVFVALGIQYAMLLCHIVICGFSGSKYFSTYLINSTIKKKVYKNKICVLIFSTTFVWNIFHSMKKWARYDQKCTLVFMLSTHYPCHIFMKLEFSRQILYNIQISNFVKICPVGAKLFHVEGQTDRHCNRSSRGLNSES